MVHSGPSRFTARRGRFLIRAPAKGVPCWNVRAMMRGMTRSSQASSRYRAQGPWAPALLVASVLLTLLACGATQDKPAIKVGARTVGLSELEQGFWDYVAADSSARPDTANLRRYVDKTVDRVLSEILAEAEIKDLEPARFDRVQEFNEKTWVDVLRQEEFGSAYHPSERDLKAAWEKLGRRLHLRYMLLGSEAEANEIRGALEQGAVFAKIAEQRSQDAESRSKGGDLGFVSYLDMDPLGRDEIFSLPVGGISKPIPWGAGYQIFQVVQEQVNDGRGTLAEERRRLEQGIITKSVRAAREKYEQMLLDKYHFKMDPEQVAWMTVLLRERTKSVNRGEDLKALGAQEDGSANAASSPLPWTGSPVPPADTSRVLATFDPPEGRVKPLLLFDQLFVHPMPTWPRFETGADVEALLKELALERFEIREAQARKIDQRPEVKARIEAHLREVKVRQWNRNVVRAKLRPTEEELRAYYDAHASDYAQAEARRFVAINLGNPSSAARAAALLRSGKSCAEIQREVAPSDTSWKSTGDAGTPWLTYGRSPLLDDTLFRLPLGGVSDPIAVGPSYTVAKVAEIRPFAQKSFDEVKVSIQMKMVDQRVDGYLRELLAQAREANPVTIDWKVVDRVRLKPPQ